MESTTRILLIHALFFLFSTFTLFSSATSDTDTLSWGQSLTFNQTLISKGGKFELGFFKPRDSLSYYVGIWYKKVSVLNKTCVWVANRDAPLTDPSSSELKLLTDGDLVLFDHSKRAVWSTAMNMKLMNSSEAVLGDDGNLVLRHGLDPSDVYWQSIDYPSDTWLSGGGRLGYDIRNKRPLSLTSWRSPSDPSPGLFSLSVDLTENQWIMEWNQTQTYWNSGPWNGETFTGLPEMILNKGVFDTRYIETTNMSYFTISVVNPSMTAKFSLDFTGQVKMVIWDDTTQRWFQIWDKPSKQCEVYAFCGTFAVCNKNGLPLCECMKGYQPRFPVDWNMSDFRGGCVSKSYMQCGNTFFPFPNVTLPVNRQSVDVASADDCKLTCLNNCSCSAYAYRSAQCSVVNGDLSFVPQSYGGTDLHIRLPTSEEQRSGGKHKNTNTGYILGGVGALITSVLIYTWFKTRARRKVKNNGGDSKEGSRKDKSDLPLFSSVAMATCTNNFSDSNKIGEGGCGPVYKGVLPTGEEIAIKRFSKGSSQGLQEFMNEVLLIAKLQHRNLVKLLGSCTEEDERMLIYEYMPNKSLDYFIFDKERSVSLNWEKRVVVVVGIARGLLYLHRDSQLRIIHRDLKAGNILLDSDMNPKISDFGIARTFGRDQTEENTMRVVGTYGYMSPEYATDGIFSVKSDVFSFGVLVLEIVTGERNRRFNHADHDLNLVGHAWNVLNAGKALELVDSSIEDSSTESEVLKCIHIGLLCVQKNPEDRPTMSSVLSMLEGDGTMLPWPKQPGFYAERSAEIDSSSLPATACTRNAITDTLTEGR